MSLRRNFAVSVVKALNRRQNYVVVLDFERVTVSFHKIRRGKEVKRVFPFHACVKLDKNVKDNVSLTVRFGHEPGQYKKTLCFQSMDERELFCNLIHAVIVTGNRAVKLYKVLEHAHSTGEKSQLEIMMGNNAKAAGAAGTAASPAPGSAASPPPAGGAGAGAAGGAGGAGAAGALDFCSFLISFSSAHTQLDNKSAMTGPLGGSGGEAAPEKSTLQSTMHREHQSSISVSQSQFSGGGLLPSGSDSAASSAAAAGSDDSSSNSNVQLGGAAVTDMALLEGEQLFSLQSHTSRIDILLPFASAASGTASAANSNANASYANSNAAAPAMASRGNLYLTNFRIIYRDYAKNHSSGKTQLYLNGAEEDYSVEVPLGLIGKAHAPRTATPQRRAAPRAAQRRHAKLMAFR
jgi:hypothetical protein